METLATRKWALAGPDWLAPRSWASCLESEKKISVVYKLLILRHFCYISPSRPQKLLPRSGGAAATSENVAAALQLGDGPRPGLQSACQGLHRAAGCCGRLRPPAAGREGSLPAPPPRAEWTGGVSSRGSERRVLGAWTGAFARTCNARG